MKLFSKIHFFIFLIFPLSMTACSYGGSKQHVLYENSFFPWPTSVNYSSIIDCYKSYFKCNYDNEYEYFLLYKSGHEVNLKGRYKYDNESFVLLDGNGETLLILNQLNYYRYTETIVYDGVEYTIIWHAQHIFD